MNLDPPKNITANLLDIFGVLESCDRGGSRLQALKVQTDKLAPDDQQAFYQLLFAATSPTLTFGVKDLPEPGQKYEMRPPEVFYPQLFWLLRQLSQRLLTGNNARAAIAQFQDRSSAYEVQWVQRILRQDLRLDMGAKEINKALGFKLVPLFEVPLATDWNKVKLEKVLGQSRDWVMQPKLDGGRCVAILPPHGGQVQLLSRTGKAWKNFKSIQEKLQMYNESRLVHGPNPDETLILDGEVVSLDEDGKIDFQQIQKTMMRNDGVEVGILQYVVFDASWALGWYTPTEDYRVRLIRARDCCKEMNTFTQRVKVVPTEWWIHQARHGYRLGIHDDAPVVPTEEFLREAVEQEAKKAVEEGYEGLMLRAADLPVENKRGKFLLKVKTFKDTEAKLTGYTEGTGKYEGGLGALICQLPSGKTFEVGSGFSDKQRRDLYWEFEQKPTCPEKIVSFKYFELTDDGIPRFPIFRGFRSPDDIGPTTEVDTEPAGS